VSFPVVGDGTRYRGTVDCWYVAYRDHAGVERTQKAYRDRRLSDRLRLDIEDREERVTAGDLSPATVRRKDKALGQLLDEWAQAIRDRGVTGHQADQMRHRAEATLREAGISRAVDLNPKDVTRALAVFRRDGVPRSAEDRRKRKAISAQTSNHFLGAVKAFSGWCVDAGYLDADPVARAKGVRVAGGETFKRRALDVGELDRLVAATVSRKGRGRPSGLAGPDRAMVYFAAFYTGLRLNELAVLTPADFRLDDAKPSVVLAAKHTKNRREARQYLPRHAAERLRTYLAGKPVGRPLWGHARNFFAGRRAARTLRLDLAAAGIPSSTPAGRIDFHAIRASYITGLVVAGVPLPFVQRAARHSDPRLTMRYVHTTDEQLADEVGKLGT
jgi:integrase